MHDRDWIAAAARRYERPLFVYVLSLLGDRHRTQDVVQEAFLKLCKQSRHDIEPKLAGWLFAVCRNRALDIRRKEQRMTALIADPPGTREGPAEMLERADAAEAVFARLASLPADQQEAVRLRFQNQFSYREIAGVMGLSESHVGVLLHVALKALRRSFAEPAPTESRSHT